MIHKVILVILVLLATIAFGLNLLDFPEKTWYHHGKNGRVTGATGVRCHGGALIIVLERGYDHQNPTWLHDVDLWTLYTRHSYFSNLHGEKLHADGDALFVMTIVNDVGLWPLVVVFGGYPAFAFIRGPLRRYRLRRMGCCQKCGYDLTGNVSGRCPECGTKIDARTR